MKRNESKWKIEWQILKKVELIISKENLDWWHTKLTAHKRFILRGHILQSLKVGTLNQVSEIPDYEREIVGKMYYEMLVMWAVLNMFLDKLDIAKKKNDTLFLNTAYTVFNVQEYDQFFVAISMGRGRKIDKLTIAKRLAKVKEYVNSKKTLEDLQMEKTGTFYQRDIPAYLCNMAYKAFMYMGMKFKENPEFAIERQAAVQQINSLMQEYVISPWQLSPTFDTADHRIDDLILKEEPPITRELIDEYIKRLRIWKKLTSPTS